MKRQIDGFSNYYYENEKVYRKKDDSVVNLYKRQYRLTNDQGKYCALGIRKLNKILSYKYKDYKQIEKELGVKYKSVYGSNDYLFCQDVEDKYKVWSNIRCYFLTGSVINKHLKFTLNNKTKAFYYCVWEYYKQQFVPKDYVLHHINLNARDDRYSNLFLMTDKAHKKLHRQLQLNKG